MVGKKGRVLVEIGIWTVGVKLKDFWDYDTKFGTWCALIEEEGEQSEFWERQLIKKGKIEHNNRNLGAHRPARMETQNFKCHKWDRKEGIHFSNCSYNYILKTLILFLMMITERDIE